MFDNGLARVVGAKNGPSCWKGGKQSVPHGDVLCRFPHSVTLAGTLEMGATYLPINSNWFEYVNRANEAYDKLQKEGQETLMSLADEANKELENER